MATELEFYVEGTEMDATGAIGSYSVQLLPRQSGPSMAEGGTHGPTMLVDPLDWGQVPTKFLGISVPYGGGLLELGNVVDDLRMVRITIHEVAGSERAAIASLADWNHKFRTAQAPLTLRAKWHDGTALRDVFLIGRRDTSAGFGSGIGNDRAVLKGKHDGGVLRLAVVFRCPIPYWREYAEDTTNTVAIATTTQNLTIQNDGDVPIGARFALSALVGSWTAITVTNNTTGPDGESGGTLTWIASPFASADAIDWKHSDMLIPSWDETLAPGSNFVLWPGDNDVDVIGVGGTSGTGTFTIRRAWEDIGN